MNLDDYKALKDQEPEKVEEPKSDVKAKGEETQPNVPESPATVKVGDNEVTIDELTKGYLRQSDYTKKTTELSTQKRELETAVALYDSVKNNPEMLKQFKDAGGDEKLLKRASSEARRIADLESKLAGVELDKQLAELKAKYPDFNEVDVINEAAKRKMTDLEFIYKATRKVEKGDNMDAKELKAQLMAELKAELGLSDEVPPSIVGGKNATIPINGSGQINMSSKEHQVAMAMGLSDEEYIKFRDAK